MNQIAVGTMQLSSVDAKPVCAARGRGVWIDDGVFASVCAAASVGKPATHSDVATDNDKVRTAFTLSFPYRWAHSAVPVT